MIQDFQIALANIYIIDEVGFLMGSASSERVLEVVRSPRYQGRLHLPVFGSQGMYQIVESFMKYWRKK